MTWLLIVVTMWSWPPDATVNASLPVQPIVTFQTMTSSDSCTNAAAAINNSAIAKGSPTQIKAMCRPL